MSISMTDSKTIYNSAGDCQYTLTTSLVENSTDVANNTSNVTVTATLSSTNWSFNTSPNDCYLEVQWWDSNANAWSSKRTEVVQALGFNSSVSATATFNAQHKADGSLRGQSKAIWTVGGSSYYAPMSNEMKNPTGIDLTVIPRASKPTAEASSVKIGNTVRINTNRSSSAFTHTIKARFGSSSEEHAVATGVTTSAVFDTGSTNYVADLVSAQSSGKTTVTITCTTYNGSTQIGDPQQCTLTVVISPSVPTVSQTTFSVGDSVTVSTNREDTATVRKHTVQVKFASRANRTIGTAKQVADSVTFNSTNYLANTNGIISAAGSASSVTATFTCTTYVNGISIGAKTCTATIKINPSVPTVDPSVFTTGDVVTVKSNRTTSARTHTLYIVIGGTTTQVSASAGDLGASASYPTVGNSTIGGAVMSAAGKTLRSVSGTFRLDTILNGTIIGSRSVAFTANVNTNAYRPDITFGALSDRDEDIAKYHGSGEMINLLSKLRQVINFRVTSGYEELAGGTISLGTVRRTLTAEEMTTGYNFDVDGVTADTITVTATDTRGTTVTATASFTLLGYKFPTITSSSVSRVTMTGTAATFTMKGTGYKATYTGTDTRSNKVTITYRTRVVGGSWSTRRSAGEATMTGTGNRTWSMTNVALNRSFDYTKQYEVELTATDEFGNSAVVKRRLFNGVPVFGWGKTHFDVYGKFHIHDRDDVSKRWILPDGLDAMMFSEGSKNLLHCESHDMTHRGVTYTYDVWDRVTLTGTATGGNSYVLYGTFTCPRAGDYIFSGCPATGGGSKYYMQVQSSSSAALGNDYGSGVTINCTYGYTYKVYIIVQENQSLSDIKFAPMVRLAQIASDTYSPFAPTFALLPNYALMPRGTLAAGSADNVNDLGIYRVVSTASVTNLPATAGVLIVLNPFTWETSSVRWQIFMTSTPAMYLRYRSAAGSWGAWRQVTTSAVS